MPARQAVRTSTPSCSPLAGLVLGEPAVLQEQPVLRVGRAVASDPDAFTTLADPRDAAWPLA